MNQSHIRVKKTRWDRSRELVVSEVTENVKTTRSEIVSEQHMSTER